MKAISFALFVALLIVGCGESSDPSDPSDSSTTPEVLEDATADAVDSSKLQDRNGIMYLANEENPFTGRAESFYENGQEELESNYKDGKSDGIWTGWYENGHKKGEAKFKDGKADGLRTFWYENGQIESEVNLKDGKQDGIETHWYENGQYLKEQRNWKDGKLMSIVAWKPDGEKCPETNVKDGNGVLVVYEEDGTEKARATFKDGELVED